MKTDIQKAVQQIMLGSVTKTETQALHALETIKAAGYDGIELNGFMIHPTSFLVRAMTKAAGMPVGKGGNLNWSELIRKSGLQVTSLHSDLGSLKREPAKIAEEAGKFGTAYVVITGMYRFDYGDDAAIVQLCEDLDECGRHMAEQGISLLYHNHNVEFRRLSSGQTAYNYLLEHTDENYVNFEFDSYWPTEAGVNVQALMEKLGTRMKLWHINDRGSRASGLSMTPILTSDSMELGCGNMDLEALTEQAMKNGIAAVILESHRNWVDNDPLKSLQLSANFLNEHF